MWEGCLHRWTVEQLSGVMTMSKEAASARMDTLHFLALHAFFTVDPGAAKKVLAWSQTNLHLLTYLEILPTFALSGPVA